MCSPANCLKSPAGLDLEDLLHPQNKVFAWFLIMDRLNTEVMLMRRHWKFDNGPQCVLCPRRVLEDQVCLFFQCNFSARIWNYLQITWPMGQDMMDIAVQAMKEFDKPFFAEVVFLAWWNIWMVRNAKVFRMERALL